MDPTQTCQLKGSKRWQIHPWKINNNITNDKIIKLKLEEFLSNINVYYRMLIYILPTGKWI